MLTAVWKRGTSLTGNLRITQKNSQNLEGGYKCGIYIYICKVKWNCATRISRVSCCHKTSGNMRVAQLELGLLITDFICRREFVTWARRAGYTPMLPTTDGENKLVSLIHVTYSCTTLAASSRPCKNARLLRTGSHGHVRCPTAWHNERGMGSTGATLRYASIFLVRPPVKILDHDHLHT
jgi:hypothetical protein